MLVAALLLQETNNRIKLSTLVKNSIKLYVYIRMRRLQTFMTMDPQKDAVSRVLKGLGFQTKAITTQGKKGIINDSEIILDNKHRQETLVTLAYYSNGLL